MKLRCFFGICAQGLWGLNACSSLEGGGAPRDAGKGADQAVQEAEGDAAFANPVGISDAALEPARGLDGGRDGSLPTLVLPSAEGPLRVEIGVPDYQTGLGFSELAPGGAIPIGGLGQAGLTARLGLRVKTPDGSRLEEAYVRVELLNDEDSTRDPGLREFDVPDILRCDPDGWCYAATVRVEISHLAKLPELEGTRVRMSATLTDASDATQRGSGYAWGYLQSGN